MDGLTKFVLYAELEHTYCALNHGPNTDPTDYPAVDYIVQTFEKEGEEDIEVVIPVCVECYASVSENGDWTLVYCLDCTSNQWICRSCAKLKYRHSVLWLKGCPECTNKFGGLFFTDSK